MSFESGNYIGKGELTTFKILEQLTGLHKQSLKSFGKHDGLYQQVPISFILSPEEFRKLNHNHQKSSIDIFLIKGITRIAIRVQGKGHGQGLKGLGKAKFDSVQKKLLEPYCKIVDITIPECKEIFKERFNTSSILELVLAFKTQKINLPVLPKYNDNIIE